MTNKDLDTDVTTEHETDTRTTDNDWAAAMAEQAESTVTEGASQASGLGADDPVDDWGDPVDDWGAALAEQTAGTDDFASAQIDPVAPDANLFKPLDSGGENANRDVDMIMDIPVQLSVELGRTRMTLKHILQLGQGSVVELDGLAGEPMDVFVNGYLIAQGEVVVVDEKYGIRITDIVTPSDRIRRLNSRR